MNGESEEGEEGEEGEARDGSEVAAQPAPHDSRWRWLLGCFFLSGLAALIYQTAWTRQLALVFGSSELAIATVLAAYMAGLASGAAVAGRLADRVRRPVLAYGLVELGIAAGALLVPLGLRAAAAIHEAFYGGLVAPPDHGGAGQALFYLIATWLLLLPPTALMGATLPLLARHAVTGDAELGGRVATLYGWNTLGAVAGTLLTAFVLLPWLGLSGTIGFAIATNALVFLAALRLARWSSQESTAVAVGAAAATQAAAGEVTSPAAGRSWIGPCVLVSGVLSFTYEIVWSRLLQHVLGGSVDAFAAMLASFLVGIALGSLLVGRFATDPRRASAAFGAVQLAIGFCALWTLRVLDGVPLWVGTIGATGAAKLALDAAVAIGVLLPMTIGIGATFPLAVRIRAQGGVTASAASGSVYAWNTFGAIAGALGAAYWAVPALGFARVVSLAVVVHAVLALLASELGGGGLRGLRLGALALLALLVLAPPRDPEMLLRSSPLERVPAQGAIDFLEVGRSATVLLLEEQGTHRLRTNGLPESRVQPTGGREATAGLPEWLSHLPTLLRPQAEELLVVGLGGGAALERIPERIRRVDVVELEPAVVRANQHMAGLRTRDPLADPRVRLVVNDVRSALTLTMHRYDAIVSQPSHPWTAGSAHLYTHEFMQLAQEHLEPGGVLVQWMGLRYVDRELLASLLATIRDVFPHVLVFQPGWSTLVVAASDAPFAPEESIVRALAEAPEEYAAAGFRIAEDVLAHHVLNAEDVKRVAGVAVRIRDDRNVLQMRSPALVRAGGSPLGRGSLFPDEDPWLRARPGLSRPWVVWRLTVLGMEERAERIADAAPSSDERALARAALHLARGRRGDARTELASAGATPEAARLRWLAGESPDPLALDTDAGLQAVVRARAALGSGDLVALRALAPDLSRVVPPSLLSMDAARLRASQRIAEAAGGDRAAARDALRILDPMLALSNRPGDLLLRARAAVLAGFPKGALAVLHELAQEAALRPDRPPELARVLRGATNLLARMPDAQLDPSERSALRERLTSR